MDRKQKYTLIKKVTGNSKLAQKGRDWSKDRINREILSMYESVKEVSPRRTSKTKRAFNRKIKYDKARNAGYTPKEATRMQDWSIQHINNVVRGKVIVNVSSRRKRWKYMSIKRKMDYDLEIMARNFNKRKHAEMLRKKRTSRASAGLYKTLETGVKVYDKNHGFGWGIVYTAYTRGLDPEKLYKNTTIDPFIPEIYKLPNSL